MFDDLIVMGLILELSDIFSSYSFVGNIQCDRGKSKVCSECLAAFVAEKSLLYKTSAAAAAAVNVYNKFTRNHIK